ncbi:MAG: hypothetical protein R2856_15110 [Caldilineaceae bacterium]
MKTILANIDDCPADADLLDSLGQQRFCAHRRATAISGSNAGAAMPR